MRIIAGSHKGRRLLSPQANDLRPTSGRVKGALFSILGDRIPHATVLDLFAGTGAIRIEALSRGAARVIFVESHPASLRLLHTNLDQCGLLVRSEVYPGGAAEYLQRASRKHIIFDVVFADPPYREDSVNTVLPLLAQSAMILPHTVVILEHPTKYQIPPQIGPLNRDRQYRYGDTSLSLFRLIDEKASCL
jgi:16S rRNA (guanine966-N2)-methyltransferase